MVADDRVRARRMPVRSPFSRVSPALSIATSVPDPMAMPTSAAASAGASLTPSPAIATTRPCAFKSATTWLLRSGRISASTSVMPSFAATARAVTLLSPVNITTRMPDLRKASSAACVVDFTASAMANIPAALPSMAAKMALAPSLRRSSARAASAVTSTPSPSRNSRLPISKARPSTLPRTPLPFGASKSSTGGSVMPRACAAATMAAARGCSLARSAPAASRSTSSSASPSAATMATSDMRPSVRVPVLSTTSVSTSSIRSSASALRTSTPAWAPRPTPITMDIGVARPSAQGQAMISTATALAIA